MATKTTAEKAIREQTPSGGLVDLSELAETERSLAAESVRALCLEEAEGMDPRGVRIKGASIVGKLDCSFAALARPLTLLETSFSEAPCFDHCTVPALTLQDCVLPGLEAEGLRVAFDLDLGRTHVEGAVWLTGAQIAGRLHCDGAELDGEDGQAFRGDNIHIGGDAFFREGFRAHGTVWLPGATITGYLEFEGATIDGKGSAALFFDSSEIGGAVFLRHGFRATGEVRLIGTRIGGNFECTDGSFENGEDTALTVDTATIGGNAYLNEKFKSVGTVRLQDVKVRGDLDLEGAELSRQNGDALLAESAEIGGSISGSSLRATGTVSFAGTRIGRDLVLDGASLENEKETSLSVIGADIGGGAFMRAPFSSKGELGLLGTRLGGNLELSGAALANPGGDALSADTADIGGNAFLNDGFAATGTVRLLGTKVGRDLTCDDSTLEGDEVALLADGIEIGKSASFMGAGLRGTVRLIGATIGGVLSFDGATLAPTDQDSVALLADSVEIGEDVFLRQGFRTTGALRLSGAQIGANFELTDAVLDVGGGEALIATGTDVKGTLVLTGTRIAGGVALFKASAATLGDDLGPRGLGSWGSAHPLVLEDFSYATFDGEEAWDTDARFRWLRRTLSFDPGSWERLIEVYRTHGRDDEARSAAIAMENDRLRRGGLSPLRRAGRWILRVTIGHGYRPWLALLWAVAIVVPFALLVWRAPGGTFVPTSEGATGSPQPLAYSLDTFLPIVDLGEADQWTVTGGLRWVAWAVILLGWALTTIFVAGFTRIVRSV